MDDMDGKQSSLREQLVIIKEKLNRAVLDKEIMEAEQGEIVEALTKVSDERLHSIRFLWQNIEATHITYQEWQLM